MDSGKEHLECKYLRRFGAEIEVNAFDLRNRPEDPKAMPEGTPIVADIVQKASENIVQIHKWAYDHNNQTWIIKPDSSCGIEICTPVLKGWRGLMEVCRVVDALGRARISVDDRCSFHVHIDVGDLKDIDIAAIITWWIKCEPVFMDSVPSSRKRNQYCQLLGQHEAFDRVEDGFLSPENLIRLLGHSKYFTINTYHYFNQKRKSIEFRIMDGECCINPWDAKNWIRLVVHFVERALKLGMPSSYFAGDRWSGYCWLDPVDVFQFLGFEGEFILSDGLKQVKAWFLDRLYLNCQMGFREGIMSNQMRRVAVDQIDAMISSSNVFDKSLLYYDDAADDYVKEHESIFSEKYRI
jgi:hypothetical protein